jgi:DNA-binding response OmpR family regulator
MKDERPIMIVEDDPVDLMSIKRAFAELRITNDLITVESGQKALDIIHAAEIARPTLVLLDLRMPGVDGLEVLKELRKSESYGTVNVVILTTSNEERDKVATFELGISGYMVKPVDYRQFVEVVRAIDLYWTLSQQPGDTE